MSRLSKAAFWLLLFGLGFSLGVILSPHAGDEPKPQPLPQSFPERPPEREIERHTREETIAWLKRIYGAADFEAAMEWIASLESSMQECRWCNQAQSYYWRAR